MLQIHREAGSRLLAQASDEASFEAALEQAYQEIGLLPALDFSAVRAYWRGTAALPPQWRRALAAAQCAVAGGQPVQDARKLAALHRVLVRQDAADWFAAGERCALLLSPLFAPDCLSQLPTPLAGEGAPPIELVELYAARGLPGLDAASLQNARIAVLRDWAALLQQGAGDWAALTALYRSCGVDPALPAQLLATMAAAQWQADAPPPRRMLALFNRLQLTCLLLREQLLQAAEPDPDWSLGVLAGLAHFGALQPGWQLLPATAVDELVRALLRPLCLAAVHAPGLRAYLHNSNGGANGALILTGLLQALAAQPARWQWFLQESPPLLLHYLPLDQAPDFVRRFAPQALALEQLLWTRHGWFKGGVSDAPEAIDWYRGLLDQITDNYTCAKTFLRIARNSSEAVLHELLQQVLQGGRSLPAEAWQLVHDCGRLQHYVQAGGEVADGAAFRLGQLALQPGAAAPRREPYWSALLQLSTQLPALALQQTALAAYAGDDSMARWEALWQACCAAPERETLAAALLHALASGGANAETWALAEKLYAAEPQPFRAYAAFDRFDRRRVEPAVFCAALQASASPLRALIVTAVAHALASSGNPRPAPEMLLPALIAFPQAFAALEEKYRLRLLPLFSPGAVAACAATLMEIAATTSKPGRNALQALFARTPLDALRRAGLLDAAEPRLRRLILTALALNPDTQAPAAIEALIDDAAHDDYSRGLSLDALACSGRSLRGLDDWADATLPQQQALAQEQKIPAALAKAWNADTARLLQPLGEALGRYLLAVLQQSGDALPRRARQILAWLPPARRADLAAYGVKTWVDEDGVDKFNWLLLPLPEYGDERVVGDLVRAVKAWAAKRKLKAVAALRQLALVPGDYGLARVRDLRDAGKFSPFVHNATIDVLAEAAAERGLELDDLLEQLLPDFGFRGGVLQLDLGSAICTARLRGDFSLQLYDPAGKVCKSLPRARAGDDAQLRGLAENQLKMLARNLKPLYRQQAQKLLLALQTGRRWPLAQWRRLFVEHGLQCVLAQNVVWAVAGAGDESLARFRVDASGELVDATDSRYELPAAAELRIAHPLEMAAGECAAWRQQFADYALVPPLQQLELPVFAPQPGELAATAVRRADGCRLYRTRFGGLLEKWGYLKDSSEDNYILSHCWEAGPDWCLEIRHSGISARFDATEEVQLDSLRLWRRANGQRLPLTLAELPAALRATVLAQAEALREAAL